MMINTSTTVDWIKRHGSTLLLALVIILVGGLRHERLEVFKTAALAECVALCLSSFAVYVFTPDDYSDREARHARTTIFRAVHVLVGLVFCGSYFVEFAPGA